MLPGKSFTPKEIAGIARRRWWLIVIPPIVTLFAALLYSSTLRDVYRSDMLIAVVPQRVPDEFVRSTVTLQTQERLSAIQVQVTSRSVLEPIVTEFDLFPEERTKLPMEDVVQKVRTAMNVRLEGSPSPRGQETTAFRVSFTYPDPEIAVRVTQRLGSIFVDQNARDRGAVAKATDDFLQQQLTTKREQLEEHEQRMEAFRQLHGHALPSQLQSNLQAIQNAQLQVQALVEAIARDRDRKLMLERLHQEALNESVAPAPVPVATGPATGSAGAAAPAGGTTQQQLDSARQMLTGLELRWTPEHPDIVKTKRVIAELETKLQAENKTAVERGSAEPQVLTREESQRRDRLRAQKAEIESLDRLTVFKESEERRLRELITEYQRRIEAVPGLESEWVSLTRDYETKQADYRDLLRKSQESKIAVDLESRQIGEHFRILDPARLPTNPISPIRYQITAAGAVSGLLFGLAIIALLEIIDSSFRSELDVARLLSVPVLANVPYVETAKERRRRRIRALAFGVAGVTLAIGAAYVFWMMKLWTVVV